MTRAQEKHKQGGKFLVFPTFQDFSYFFLLVGQIPTFSTYFNFHLRDLPGLW